MFTTTNCLSHKLHGIYMLVHKHTQHLKRCHNVSVLSQRSQQHNRVQVRAEESKEQEKMRGGREEEEEFVEGGGGVEKKALG